MNCTTSYSGVFSRQNNFEIVVKGDPKKVTEKTTEKTKIRMTTIMERMQLDMKYKVEEMSGLLNVGRSRTRTLLKNSGRRRNSGNWSN
ncbi:MAG: hypothetical protein K2K21_00665 [Lachnospiraceae bacterium]|nr:hypothetical protein [Lachnospiraceae bacterium]